MHNSLHIRDLLRRTHADTLCVARRDPHRLVERDPAARAGLGEVTVADGWVVACAWPDREVAGRVEADLAHFLRHLGVTMGVPAFGSVDLSLLYSRGRGRRSSEAPNRRCSDDWNQPFMNRAG